MTSALLQFWVVMQLCCMYRKTFQSHCGFLTFSDLRLVSINTVPWSPIPGVTSHLLYAYLMMGRNMEWAPSVRGSSVVRPLTVTL